MSNFKTIKELVIETCISEGVFPTYEKLTSLVRQHFPTSKWKKTHWYWYRNKIRAGEIFVPGISVDENEDSGSGEPEAEMEEEIEAAISLERDLHTYLSTRLNEIEPGLSLAENGIEYKTDAGNIDLLAIDSNNRMVIIELKAGKAKDNALGQLLGYMGCLSASQSNVRGILVASGFDTRVIFGAKGLPAVKLLKYQVSFSLQEIT
jgi:hypothetical protein